MAPNQKSKRITLSRTEIVQARLTPKVRYMAELGARKHRRTLSSFIEWAVAKSLNSVNCDDGTETISIADKAAELWDVDADERLAKLARIYPELMTYEEQVRWKAIRGKG